MLANLLDSYAKAVRPLTGQDTAEGNTQDFGAGTILWHDRPCSYQEASGSIQRYYQQRSIAVSNVLYFDQDPGDLANCLVSVTRPQTGDTLLLIVMGVQDPIQWGATWVWPVGCQRIRQPSA